MAISKVMTIASSSQSCKLVSQTTEVRFPPFLISKTMFKEVSILKGFIKFPGLISYQTLHKRTFQQWGWILRVDKHHSTSTREVIACCLVGGRQRTETSVEEKTLGLDSLEVLFMKFVNTKAYVLSICKDIFKIITGYYGHLKDPLLTFYHFGFIAVFGLPKRDNEVTVVDMGDGNDLLNEEMLPLCECSGTLCECSGTQSLKNIRELYRGICESSIRAQMQYPE
ncbi:LOW QUALITY PROTEIN: hypothetical protein J0S82_019476, partial [Galemys pyrenaicus]